MYFVRGSVPVCQGRAVSPDRKRYASGKPGHYGGPRLTIMLAALALPLAAVSAPQPGVVELQSRLDRLESVTLVDLLTRMQVLQAELRELRGALERIEHRSGAADTSAVAQYRDLDARLSRLEAGAGTTTDGRTPPGTTTGSPASGAAPWPAPGAGAAPGSSALPPTAATPPGAPASAAQSEQAEYEQAFALLKAGRYGDAERELRGFLARYPEGRLADNAQYWLGEIHFVARDYSNALNEFNQLLTRYPDSPKVADGLYKIGSIHAEQGRAGEARRAYEDLLARYPESTAARLAQERLQRLP